MRKFRIIVPVVASIAVSACQQRSAEPAPGTTPTPAPAGATPATLPASVSGSPCVPRVGAVTPPATLAAWADGAQLFDDLGTFHRKVTTKSDEAQQYFDQGMRLVWGFNHDEATRAFVKAATLDPDCASCWWGAALTMGPNYNVPMLPDRAQAAWDAMAKANAAAPKATPVEKALIAALGKRFKGPGPLDPPSMQPYIERFAKAMGEVAKKYPDDNDVQVMYAESMMNVNPWKLWSLDGKPAPGTEEIVARLEAVLAKDPNHPGANHYYIHAVEASREPGKALASADRLAGLMKGAGHIVHMPAHIYQRVGRYQEAEAANVGGAIADVAYMAKVTPVGYYAMYLTHNYDFESYSQAMEGKSAASIAAGRKTIDAVPRSIIDGIPGMDFAVAKSYMAQVRFGKWDDLLAEKAPDEKYPAWTGMYRFARAYAMAAKGRLDEAQKEREALDAYSARLPADLYAGYNPARDVLNLGSAVLGARIAQGRGQEDEAVKLLKDAVAREDLMAYDEPADWFFPTRHLLGAALLEAGDAAGAEAVYREDLGQHPENGWALFGLAQALEAQKKDATDIRRRFEAAWSGADVKLVASAF